MEKQKAIRIRETGEVITSNYSVDNGKVYIFGENGRLISDYNLYDVEVIDVNRQFNADWCDFLTREQSSKLIELGVDHENASYTMTYYSDGTQCEENDVYHDPDGHLVDIDGFEIESEIKERWRGDYDYKYVDDAPVFSVGDIMRLISHDCILDKEEDSVAKRFTLGINFIKREWECVYMACGKLFTKTDPILGNVLYKAFSHLIKLGYIRNLKDNK